MRNERGLLGLLVLCEAIVIFSYGVFLVVETVVDTGGATEPAASAVLAAGTVLLGLALAAAARGLRGGARAATAPVVLWQLLQLALGVPAIGPRWYVGVPLVLLAVVVLAGVLVVASVEARRAGEGPPRG